MIGHILTVKHFNAESRKYEFFRYQIIGTRKNRFGEVSDYFIPVWDAQKQFFRAYSANSYFLVEVSAKTEKLVNRYAAEFIRFTRMANYCETIRRRYALQGFVMPTLTERVNAYGDVTYTPEMAYEVQEPQHLDMIGIAKRKRDKYRNLANEALIASGLANAVNHG